MSNELAESKENLPANPHEVRRGFEVQSSQEDIILPRAKLFHGTPEEQAAYPEARGGQILNSITQEVLPAFFCPIIRQIEWIRFNGRDTKSADFDPNHKPGELIWRSSNPNDPRVIKEGAFGEDGTPPLAPKFLSFLSIFPGENMPIIVSFSKTSFKAGKMLNSLLEFSSGDMWEYNYKLTTRLTKSDQFTYYVFDVKRGGKTTEEDAEKCARIYNQFKHKKIEVPMEDPEPEPSKETVWKE